MQKQETEQCTECGKKSKERQGKREKKRKRRRPTFLEYGRKPQLKRKPIPAAIPITTGCVTLCLNMK